MSHVTIRETARLRKAKSSRYLTQPGGSHEWFYRNRDSTYDPILLLIIQSDKLIPYEPFYESQLKYLLLQKKQLKNQNLLLCIIHRFHLRKVVLYYGMQRIRAWLRDYSSDKP